MSFSFFEFMCKKIMCVKKKKKPATLRFPKTNASPVFFKYLKMFIVYKKIKKKKNFTLNDLF